MLVFLNILSYLQPLLLLTFVYFLSKKVTWLFVILAYIYPFLRKVVNINQVIPINYYLYAITNDLLYLVYLYEAC